MITVTKPATEQRITARFDFVALLRARANAGLTQTELADCVGIGQNAISLFESGYKKPSGETAAALARVLGISMDELYIFESF